MPIMYGPIDAVFFFQIIYVELFLMANYLPLLSYCYVCYVSSCFIEVFEQSESLISFLSLIL